MMAPGQAMPDVPFPASICVEFLCALELVSNGQDLQELFPVSRQEGSRGAHYYLLLYKVSEWPFPGRLQFLACIIETRKISFVNKISSPLNYAVWP
jgi:hypothetical protein